MKHRFTLSLIAALAGTWMFSTFFVGCGKNESNAVVTAPPAPAPGPLGCTNCPAGMTLIASAIGRNINVSGQVRMEMGIQFFGNLPAPNTANNNVSYYSGPAAAQARLRVFINDTPLLCNLPAGDYTLTIQQPGNWDGERVYNLALVGSGPVPIQMQIPAGFILSSTPAVSSAWGETFPFRFVSTYVMINSQAPVAPGGINNCGALPFIFE